MILDNTYQDSFIIKNKEIEEVYNSINLWLRKQKIALIEERKYDMIDFRFKFAKPSRGMSNGRYYDSGYPEMEPVYFNVRLNKISNDVELICTLYVKDSRDIKKLYNRYYGIGVELVRDIGGTINEDHKMKYYNSSYKIWIFYRELKWFPIYVFFHNIYYLVFI